MHPPYSKVMSSPSPSPSPSEAGCLKQGTAEDLYLSKWCQNSGIPDSAKGALWYTPAEGDPMQCSQDGAKRRHYSKMTQLCSAKYPGNALHMYPKSPAGGITIACCPR